MHGDWRDRVGITFSWSRRFPIYGYERNVLMFINSGDESDDEKRLSRSDPIMYDSYELASHSAPGYLSIYLSTYLRSNAFIDPIPIYALIRKNLMHEFMRQRHGWKLLSWSGPSFCFFFPLSFGSFCLSISIYPCLRTMPHWPLCDNISISFSVLLGLTPNSLFVLSLPSQSLTLFSFFPLCPLSYYSTSCIKVLSLTTTYLCVFLLCYFSFPQSHVCFLSIETGTQKQAEYKRRKPAGPVNVYTMSSSRPQHSKRSYLGGNL